MQPNLKLDILFEDDSILVADKPAQLPTQGTRDPKRPHLLGLLSAQVGANLYLHHRLDRDTTGVILFSKRSDVNKSLTEQFRSHQVKKVYLALVKSKTMNNQSQGLEAHSAPETNFEVSVALAPVKGERGIERMVVVKKGGWPSHTAFRILKRSPELPLPDSALIEARPSTGRTHQIRVHLAHLKMPILGDYLYGGKSSLVPRLMLHAWKLRLIHPLTGEPIEFEAPPPRLLQF